MVYQISHKGTSILAMDNGELNNNEKDLHSFTIANDGIGIIVNKALDPKNFLLIL